MNFKSAACLSLYFAYTYIDQTGRLASVTDPVGTGGTGQSLNTTYSYYGNTGDQRLEEIKNLTGTTPLSDKHEKGDRHGDKNGKSEVNFKSAACLSLYFATITIP